MKKAIVALLLFALLMLPVAGASAPVAKINDQAKPSSDLYFNSFPQIYINASGNTSFNVSFLALMLVANTGIYMSYFPSESWDIKKVSQNELVYQSNISLKPLASEDYSYLMNQFNVSNLSNINNTYIQKYADGHESESVNKISAIVQIIIQKTNFTNPSSAGNHTPISGFDITFRFTPSSPIPGPGSFSPVMLPGPASDSGNLFLFQVLGARIQNDMEGFQSLMKPSKVLSTDHASGVEVNKSGFSSYYWWNSTYLLNNKTAALNYSETNMGKYHIVVFRYNVTSSLKSIVQDPYFSVPQVDLFKNPILQKDINNAAQFVFLHIELFSAGIGTGAIFLGISYGMYRKRRF
ncbi:MAG: hypothetical protein M1476_01545 [Candidatus Thermoplasmatota archaeon]|nr:hypothetical protein [Candidatus Thermoplasmatota archaeon]